MKTLARAGIGLSVAIAMGIFAIPAQGKVTGKISGSIFDATTGEPVVGATIRVMGTSLVTQTDEDGEYFIINVPVGEFDVAVSHIGFKTVRRQKVRVLVDLTTPVDFRLDQETVELHKQTVVYAPAPLIQRDLTSSRVIFTSERLQSLPNSIDVQSVLSYYPGVVTDRDEVIHVRGGRSGQLSYYYDGFSVQDPFIAEAGIRIMPGALEELSLISGGFNAEYGGAQSGIVNAVTREGISVYHGSIRAYEGLTEPYGVYNSDYGSLKRVGNRSLAFTLSGPVPGLDAERYTFSFAGEYLRDKSYLPHDLAITYTGTAKLAMQPLTRLRLKANVSYSTSDGWEYKHRDVNDVSFDFNLDGLPVSEQRAYLAGISGNYYFNEFAILYAGFSRFSTRYESWPQPLKGIHWSQWPGYAEDSAGNYIGTVQDNNYSNDRDFTNEFEAVGFVLGDRFDPSYRFRKAAYNALDIGLTTQLSKSNQAKFGAEVKWFSVNRDFKQFFNSRPFSELYSSNPRYLSFYAQDKLEYANMVVNLGLRYDYQDIDIAYNATPQDTVAHFKRADTKKRLSPRLGVSFPISEKTVMHFNYGVYYQLPRYGYMYFNLDGDVTSGLPLLGNPDLKPEQTISYELGVDHLIGEDLRVDVTAYVKDVSDLVTTRKAFLVASNPVTTFTNDDYGAVKGVDLTLERVPGHGNLTASVSYSFMIANGNGSHPLEPYYTYITSNTDTLAPVTEFPLDFDQRHSVTATVTYNAPQKWDARLFGLKLPGAWGLNLVGVYGSGLPFTKTASDGTRLGERNENRLPTFSRVDTRFHKDFQLGNGGRLMSFFIEVDNLFDRRNVIDVYTTTGLATDDNQRIGSGLALNEQELTRLDKLFDYDPQHFSPPRTVRTGLQMSF